MALRRFDDCPAVGFSVFQGGTNFLVWMASDAPNCSARRVNPLFRKTRRNDMLKIPRSPPLVHLLTILALVSEMLFVFRIEVGILVRAQFENLLDGALAAGFNGTRPDLCRSSEFASTCTLLDKPRPVLMTNRHRSTITSE
jgi:hypothetical protein